MTLVGTDSRWLDGDLTADWADEEDPSEVYAQRIARLLTCARLWYATTKTLDVKQYLRDTADDATIQIEVSAIVDADEETGRVEVRVSRSGESVSVHVDAWSKSGQVARLTLAIDAVTGDLLVNP